MTVRERIRAEDGVSGYTTVDSAASSDKIQEAAKRGMDVVERIVGRERLEETVFPPVRRRYAWINDNGSGFYGCRLRWATREPETPKHLLETSYALLAKYVGPSLGESAVPSVAVDNGWEQWDYGGGSIDSSIGYAEHDPLVEHPFVIELRLQLLCGGEEALKNAVCVVEDAATEIRNKYEWNGKTPWKFFVRK